MAQKKHTEATISFRCPEQWKRQVTAACALRGINMRVVAMEAISKHLRVPQPEAEAA